ncbi:hypothetical protein ONZ45_g9568 [Pleurotus djamor]|nr:hypothetical protein ONZ45_g9568 [Pleurotus djamor]
MSTATPPIAVPDSASVLSSPSSIHGQAFQIVLRSTGRPHEGIHVVRCVHTGPGRNLVVCIDGTANQFSAKSSYVVEIYSRLIRDEQQLVFYNSGIGTYAKPSFRSWSYVKQVADHTIDMAVAWNFESIVHAAYEWLSENYIPGDRIFLFGFSRGAYQARVIAGMIEKVGLVHKSSKNQVAFAYELYSSMTSQAKRDPPKPSGPSSSRGAKKSRTPDDEEILCQQFKRTLCHENVKVHFVGAWDTVSSVGVFRGKTLPETVSGMGHVCSFRHALALDERRVKFQPEYVNGGLGPQPGDKGDVKEVWFAGTHSDIPHLGAGRKVQPGQLIHHSVLKRFKNAPPEAPYVPIASPPKDLSAKWADIFGADFEKSDRIVTDVFEDLKQIFWSIQDASRAMQFPSSTRTLYGSTSMQYLTFMQSIITLRSYLEVEDGGDLIEQVPNAGEIILRACRVERQLRLQEPATLEPSGSQPLLATLLQCLSRFRDVFVTDPKFPILDMVKVISDVADGREVVRKYAQIGAQSFRRYIQSLAFSIKVADQIFMIGQHNSAAHIGVWDGPHQTPKRLTALPGEISAISPDGVHVAVAHKSNVNILCTNDKPGVHQTIHPEDHTILSLCFTHDHRFLVSGHEDGYLNFWKMVGTRWEFLRRHKVNNDRICHLSFSPSSSRLAFIRGLPGPVSVLVVDLERVGVHGLFALESPTRSTALAWSPSSDSIAAAVAWGVVRVWSANRGEILHTFKAHDSPVCCLAYRHDGQALATGSYDERIRVWNCKTWQNVWDLQTNEFVVSVAFSHDGKGLVSGGWEGGLFLWNVDVGNLSGLLSKGEKKVVDVPDRVARTEKIPAHEHTSRHSYHPPPRKLPQVEFPRHKSHPHLSIPPPPRPHALPSNNLPDEQPKSLSVPQSEALFTNKDKDDHGNIEPIDTMLVLDEPSVSRRSSTTSSYHSALDSFSATPAADVKSPLPPTNGQMNIRSVHPDDKSDQDQRRTPFTRLPPPSISFIFPAIPNTGPFADVDEPQSPQPNGIDQIDFEAPAKGPRLDKGKGRAVDDHLLSEGLDPQMPVDDFLSHSLRIERQAELLAAPPVATQTNRGSHGAGVLVSPTSSDARGWDWESDGGPRWDDDTGWGDGTGWGGGTGWGDDTGWADNTGWAPPATAPPPPAPPMMRSIDP